MRRKSPRKEFRRFGRPRVPGRLPARRIALIVVGTVLFYLLVLSDFGLLRQWKLSREAAAIEAGIERLEARRVELEAQRGQLDDDATLERIAREKYGMVKTGEHVYRIAGPDSAGNRP